MTTVYALRDAANDEALRGAPLAIYVWLATNYLDTAELRPVKVSGLSLSLRMKRHTVTRGLRLLTVRGYLERKYLGHDGYAYRVFPTRRAPLPKAS